jgi:hypothetical protein
MDTTSEQLEIDLGDDVVTIKSAEFQWIGDSGSSGISAQSIDSIDWNNMATSITIPSTYTVGATGSLNWSQDYSINGTSVYGNANVILNEKGMEIKEGGDIKIGGKSLTEAIDKIEERLGILRPNPELEDRWEELKNLRKQYQELEKDLLQKEKMWTILKKA